AFERPGAGGDPSAERLAPPIADARPVEAGPAATPAATTRVFIGSEPRMRIAETVLRFSIEQGASSPAEIVSMDYSKGGVWAGWDMGRPAGRPATGAIHAEEHAVWLTDFTNFRWAIPEVCGFTGRAIVMDVDILVLGDVHELFNLPMSKPILALSPGETGVMLFDCSAFRRLAGWPTVAEMKQSGWGIRRYVELLQRDGAFGQLPERWNCLDGRGFAFGETRLIHYSSKDTQPWRPYPERLFYRPHPDPAMEELWFHHARAAREAGRFEDPAATIQPLTAGTSISTRPTSG
ncbi:MAG: hypothetical protein OEQ13_09775, partial [Acidobacteriota bacterium]|nr:hypothetical protein [Acidobacteriota bacterium]